MPDTLYASPAEELYLDLAPDGVRRWRLALHAGFHFRIPGGLTVRKLLTSELGMDADYVENRVRTVFLGGRPVDDIDAALVRPGTEMTLSTMLPGVAGITMGRDNLIAAYRADITYHDDGSCAEYGQCVIFIKLLNFIAPETGHLFLPRGIGLDHTAWARHISGLPESFWDTVRAATLDGKSLDPKALRQLPAPAQNTIRFVTIPCQEGTV